MRKSVWNLRERERREREKEKERERERERRLVKKHKDQILGFLRFHSTVET